jgi:hypothetical protein
VIGGQVVVKSLVGCIDLDHHELSWLIDNVVHRIGDYARFIPGRRGNALKAALKLCFVTGFGGRNGHYYSLLVRHMGEPPCSLGASYGA